MELKRPIKDLVRLKHLTFNRTKVELKHQRWTIRAVSFAAFNRTKVELKLRNVKIKGLSVKTFNRTKVELKLLPSIFNP